MKDFSDPKYKEFGAILHDYSAKDPKGIWDQDKWLTYLVTHASPELVEWANINIPSMAPNPVIDNDLELIP